MRYIVGISAFYHDSAACILDNGKIIAAAQEERFTRKKHDAAFPTQALEYCLRSARINIEDVNYAVFYDKPILKFDRLLESYVAFAPRGFSSFQKAIPVWLKEKLFLRHLIRKRFPNKDTNILFTEHHESHGASAFFPSPFEEAAILTLDGVGEWTTTSVGFGSGSRITLDRHIEFPHSLGLLYSAFTYYCGFKVNSGEYKLMGLAPYGSPKYKDLIFRNLIDLKEDGSYRLNMKYFGYCDSLRMTNDAFHDLFGSPPRSPESPLDQRHMDLAASIQAATEDVVRTIARHTHKTYNTPNLVMAGGVALNCVANGKLLQEGPFKNIWIQPAAGDAGGAIGAATFAWYQLLQQPRKPQHPDLQNGSLLGPCYSDEEIAETLRKSDVQFEQITDAGDFTDRVSTILEQEGIVGWFQGPMEFGPRALGARSILGDPRSSKMQATMNLKIKYRESFRPFAPVVLEEHATEWFDLPENHTSPYMLFVAPVKESKRLSLDEASASKMQNDPDLLSRVNIVRSQIPAVTHVDFSARIQTVGQNSEPRLRALLQKFHVRNNCPTLVNTSFNIRGEPIVCTPQDALRCFAATEMDFLVLGNCIVDATMKPKLLRGSNRDEYMNRFELD